MHRFPVASLGVFALISPVFTSSHAPPQASPPQQGTTLRPINIADYEASMGLQRRDFGDLSLLNPQNQSELVYGSPDQNDRLLLANMTLYAPDGLPIVLLERFEELNVSVKCQDDAGVLSLTFGSTDAFDYAQKQWGYVNEADDGKFLFITNKDGCGPDDQRQPYVVSNITEDATTLTSSLAAQAVPWSEVAGSYDLNFGHAIPAPHLRQLHDRGLLGDVINTTKGDYNNSKSANFPIKAGQQKQPMNILTDPKTGSTIDCTNCFITGSLEVTGYLSAQNFELQDLVLTATPSAFLAELELEAIITATYGPDSLQYIKHFPEVAIPDAGISIAGIVDIGATVTYSVGANCSFSGSATVDFGLQATVPDSAQIVADYNNHGASKATGFGEGQLTPNIDFRNESASVTLSAFSQPEVKFGIDLHKIGSLEMAFTITLPEITAKLSVEQGKLLLPVYLDVKRYCAEGLYTDENSACSQNTGASKRAIKVVSDASIEIDLGIDATLGDRKKDRDDGQVTSWQLYSTSKPLPSQCHPLSLPGFTSSPNTTKVPSLPGTLPSSAALSGGSAYPTPSLGLGRRWALNSSSVPSRVTSYSSRSDPQSTSLASDGKPILGSLSSLEENLLSNLSKYLKPSGADPSSSSSARGPESTSSISESGPSLVVVSSSTPSLTTTAIPASDTQTMTHTLGAKSTTDNLATQETTSTAASLTSSGVGSSSSSSRTTSTGTPATFSTSTKSKSSSGLSQSTPSSHEEQSTTTSATSRSSSDTGSSSTLPATTSTDSEVESTSSKGEVSSILSLTTSTGPRTTSSSTPTNSPMSSRSESPSTVISTTSPSRKSTSATTTSSSNLGPSSLMSSSTPRGSETTTKVNSVSSPSKSQSSSTHTSSASTLSSPTPSTAPGPSHSTEVNAATQGASSTPSESASKGPPHAPPPNSTPVPASPQPDAGSQTAEHPPKPTETTTTPSSTPLSRPTDPNTVQPSPSTTKMANQSPAMASPTTPTPLPITSSHHAPHEPEPTVTPAKISPAQPPAPPSPKPDANPPPPHPSHKGPHPPPHHPPGKSGPPSR